MSDFDCLIVTCEHAGNFVPPRYRNAFASQEEILWTHSGWDAGALETAKLIAEEFDASLHTNTMTRLVIDFNRTLGNPEVFSGVSSGFSDAEKQELIDDWYLPYRRKVEQQLREWIADDLAVLHLSIHSFGSVVNGMRRAADVGLLYDPSCRPEVTFCEEWRAAIENVAPDIPVRLNYPYSGTDDGFTRQLRTVFPQERYAGIELELNSRDFHENEEAWKRLRDTSVAALRNCLHVRRRALQPKN